jgi:hypothetical protein
VVEQPNPLGVLRHLAAEGLGSEEDLRGQVLGQTADAEVGQRARLVPPRRDRRLVQQPYGRFGDGEIELGDGRRGRGGCRFGGHYAAS